MANRFRSAIIILSLVFGVGSVLLTLGILRSMNQELDTIIQENGGINNIFCQRKKPRNAIERVRFSMSPGLRFADIQGILREIPQLSDATPRFSGGVEFVVNNAGLGEITTIAEIMGATISYLNRFTSKKMAAGRIFTQEESDRAVPVCMISQRLANRVFGKAGWLNRCVFLNRIPFQVIGVFESEYRVIIYPIQCGIKYFGFQSRPINKCEFVVRRTEDALQACKALEKMLLRQHRGVADYELSSAVGYVKETLNKQKMSRRILLGLGLAAMLLSIIGIVNIYLSLINDNIREIGILKAIGSSNQELFLQYLFESLLLALTGGGLGLLAGGLFQNLPMLPWQGLLLTTDYVITLGIACLAGVVAGILPALMAAKLSPAQAIGWR